jgi:hypothetical protein
MRTGEENRLKYILYGCQIKKQELDMLLALVAERNAELEKTVTCKDYPEK